MNDFEFTFDTRSYQFTHEPTGYILHAEDVMMLEDSEIIEKILAGTKIQVDDFFIEVLRDTIESCSTFPFGN